MSPPYELLAGPAEVYLAPTATAFPKVDIAPAGTWVLLGTAGSKNQAEAGVQIEHNQTMVEWRSAGSTAPRKAFRTEESLIVKVTIADLTAAVYAKILGGLTVTVTPPGVAQAGESTFPLERGTTTNLYALLVRTLSPAGDAFNQQYEIPIVYQGASPQPIYAKAGPALLVCEFHALEDVTLGMGTVRSQTAVHT